jgi:hypothetical protein
MAPDSGKKLTLKNQEHDPDNHLYLHFILLFLFNPIQDWKAGQQYFHGG